MITINLKRWNCFLSTLNFILCFIGYSLVTSLFLPISSDIELISRTATIPYRIVALIISLVVIALNISKPIAKVQTPLKIYFVFWFFLIIRIFYDLHIFAQAQFLGTNRLWLYIWGICLPAMLSVFLSYRYIDFHKSLQWILFGIGITLLMALFSNEQLLLQSSDIERRVDANAGLSSISFGHLGVTGVILSFYKLQQKNISLLMKFLLVFFILLATFSVIRAASRGPMLSLVIVFLVWIFARNKNVIGGVILIFLFLLLSYLYLDQLLGLIGDISPVMEGRLRATIYEGDTSERGPLYSAAWEAFLNKPLLGKQFAIFYENGEFVYSHNIILDAFMGLGFLGGISMIYIIITALNRTYRMINESYDDYWIALILIQQIVFNMISSAIYYNQLLNALFVLIFTTPMLVYRK